MDRLSAVRKTAGNLPIGFHVLASDGTTISKYFTRR